MKFNLIALIILIILIFSCKNAKSEQEIIPAKNNSIDLYKSFGFLADSSFSIKKYQLDRNRKLEQINKNDSNEIYFERLDFDDHQFLIYNDTTMYYYFNEFPYDQMCGTEAISDFNNKKITELFQVKKEDLKRIDSDTLIHFVKSLTLRKEFRPDVNSYIILGLSPQKTKNNGFEKLLLFLIENNYKYIIRPFSTRERLVSDAVFENKSVNIENLDWDSIHKVDFKNFNYID